MPLMLGLSGAIWLGAGAAFFLLRDGSAGKGTEAAEGGKPFSAEAGMAAAGLDGSRSEAGTHTPAEAESSEAGRPETAPAGSEGHAGESVAVRAESGSAAAEGLEAAADAPDAEGTSPTPEEAAALRQIAELRAAAGDYEEAVTPLRRIMRTPTREAALLALASKVFLETGHYSEAGSFSAQLAALDPDDMENQVRLVEAEYRQGRIENAVRSAGEALARHRGNLPMLVELGSIQVERGPGRDGYGAALAAALKLKPDYAPALYLKGRKSQLEGDFRDAEAVFRRVTKLEPGNAKAWGQLGMAQYHLRKFRDADVSFRKAVDLNPRDYNTWYNLGELELGYADAETNSEAVRHFRAEAMEAYLKAIDLNPEHAQARFRVGVLLLGNGQYKEAVRQLEASLRLDDRYVPALVQLSVAYERLKEYERARDCLTRAAELDPLNKIVLDRLRRLT
jgi:tetratricopeptide (TPR) repeat protein